MKTTTIALILFLTGLDLWAQMPPPTITNFAPRQHPMPQYRMGTNGVLVPAPFPGSPVQSGPTTPAAPRTPAGPANQMTPIAPPAAATPYNSAAPAPVAGASAGAEVPAYNYNFQGVDVNQVLDLYADLVGRTVLRAGLPQASIVLHTQSLLTRTEAIQALQAVLALNGISLINVGDKFVKALPSGDANTAAAPLDYSAATNLPELGSYVTHIVQLKYVKPSVMAQIIQPFGKLPNSVFAIDSNGILVLRDYAENVKRMLEMIDQIDVSVPAEYISEVIPIKYALADDIANALSNLGGSGGASVSVGGSTAAPPISGISRLNGTSGAGGNYQGGSANQSRSFGTQGNSGGAPTTGTSFQQRLQSIINRTGGGSGDQQGQIQLFGQTKIIADQRSNALLVFATREDMATIKGIISKLDVLLSQVLIEAVIMDVSLGHTFNFGVSAAQNPASLGGNVLGGGGVNNGQSFMHFLQTLTTNYTTIGTNSVISSITSSITSSAGTNAIFGNNLGSGLSYFGSIGPTWDVAMQALESDSTATVIQRPRIQTSQAKPAQFFVGSTVPYVNNTTYDTTYGNNSSYSQLSVGVELDVTPFINPDGLVVMDINQEIDDISGYTSIDGNQVPNTDKRTLSSEIAVRDRDTIILGGFIRSDKSTSKSGVPFLSSIPILGNLFTQRSDTKDRQELIVLMRPTVLKTPEIAALNTTREEQRLPGISAAAAEDTADERRLVENQRKLEEKRAKDKGYDDGFYGTQPTDSSTPQNQSDGFFNAPPPVTPLNTNTVAPLNPQ
ncbi:MAG: secretin N-terminal domain-containing protein [Verrucomicrobiia bacterium]